MKILFENQIDSVVPITRKVYDRWYFILIPFTETRNGQCLRGHILKQKSRRPICKRGSSFPNFFFDTAIVNGIILKSRLIAADISDIVRCGMRALEEGKVLRRRRQLVTDAVPGAYAE